MVTAARADITKRQPSARRPIAPAQHTAGQSLKSMHQYSAVKHDTRQSGAITKHEPALDSHASCPPRGSSSSASAAAACVFPRVRICFSYCKVSSYKRQLTIAPKRWAGVAFALVCVHLRYEVLTASLMYSWMPPKYIQLGALARRSASLTTTYFDERLSF
jgi:hypothetical protein